MKRSAFSSKHTLWLAPSALLLLLVFQNCSGSKLGDGSSPDAADVQVSCIPKNQPCLKYKVSLSNLERTYGKMSVLVNGTTKEGVNTKAQFSSNCTQVNTITALCPFNTKVSATIQSDATDLPVKGDGRKMTITLFTSKGIGTGKFGQLEKMQDEELCFNSEDYEIYDGDIIPAEAFSSCDPG